MTDPEISRVTRRVAQTPSANLLVSLMLPPRR